MNILAVTYATVLTLTAPCSDDLLKWDAVAAGDLAGYRVTFNGVQVATPLQPAYPLGCVAGLACVQAVDRAGNLSAATCMTWEPDPGEFADFGPCRLGCKPARIGGCCTAPLESKP